MARDSLAIYSPYIYPARFPLVILEKVFEKDFPGNVVFDPFAGSGTAGIYAAIKGYTSILWDINPVTQVNVEAWKSLLAEREEVVKEVLGRIEEAARTGDPEVPDAALLEWWPKSTISVVAGVWDYFRREMAFFDADRLSFVPKSDGWALYAVLAAYASRKLSLTDDEVPKYYRSKLKRKKLEALLKKGSPGELFLEYARRRAKRILQANDASARITGDIEVSIKDAVTSNSYPKGVGLVVTSPPYLQAQEYIRCFKYDLVWMGVPYSVVASLQRLEIPYRRVPRIHVKSRTYKEVEVKVNRRLREVLENYFSAVIPVFEKAALSLEEGGVLAIFAGDATLGGKPVRIADIISEHLVGEVGLERVGRLDMR